MKAVRSFLWVSVLVSLLAACSAGAPSATPTKAPIETPQASPTPAMHSVTGFVRVMGNGDPHDCVPYSSALSASIREGAEVLVSDENSRTVGLGHLERGIGKVVTTPNEIYLQCDFSFSLEVPDAAFYGISVGGMEPVRYSRADLEALGWTLSLVLS